MASQQAFATLSTDPLEAPVPVDPTEFKENNPSSPMEQCASHEQSFPHEFSIDELREIARHFGVPGHAQITERIELVEAIRHRL